MSIHLKPTQECRQSSLIEICFGDDEEGLSTDLIIGINNDEDVIFNESVIDGKSDLTDLLLCTGVVDNKSKLIIVSGN